MKLNFNGCFFDTADRAVLLENSISYCEQQEVIDYYFN